MTELVPVLLIIVFVLFVMGGIADLTWPIVRRWRAKHPSAEPRSCESASTKRDEDSRITTCDGFTGR